VHRVLVDLEEKLRLGVEVERALQRLSDLERNLHVSQLYQGLHSGPKLGKNAKLLFKGRS